MISQRAQFGELFRLFRQRFVESDALAPEADYNTNLWQVLSVLAVPGLIGAMLLSSAVLGDRDSVWTLRGLRVFFADYSFTVAGFTALFEWDMLFPERRDFLVLTLFPIRMRDLFSAKIAALGVLLAVLTLTINVGAMAMLLLVLVMSSHAHNLEFLRTVVMFLVSSVAATAFGFLVVAVLQGVLINITPVRVFRRISPWVQLVGMSVMVLSFVLFPLFVNIVFVVAFYPAWLWWFPPYWFTGMQEATGGSAVFHSLGYFGWKMLGAALLAFGLTWTLGFARHYRRTLEAEDSVSRSRNRERTFAWLLRTPAERAVFHFSRAIIARSPKHRLFLACYGSAGVALGLVLSFSLDERGLILSSNSLRAFPFLMTFFVVSGFRAVFQFPSELPSNWAFQIAERGWSRAARNAARKLVDLGGVLPVLLVFLPIEIYEWGAGLGLLHFAIQMLAGFLLTEILFWSFDKVPFTCSYFPGKVNLALLIAIYLYGFTNYSFRMADFEVWAAQNPLPGLAVAIAAAGALAFFWRRETRRETVRFDGSEPVIQTLELS